jgi:aminoglycoside phosphotransferase (APT) family kinase protein
MSSHSVTPRSDSDAESTSSSVVYDNEPFAHFRFRVLTFALKTIWPDAAPEDITAERLPGGGFNRIIRLTRRISGQSDNTIRYILRLPRFAAAQLNRDVAALQFLQRHSKLPVPTVITFDETKHNELESPYMIQNYIAGTDLHSSFPKLDHEARCKVARELGNVFRQMLAVRSSVAGVLALPVEEKGIETTLYVAPFRPADPRPATPYSDSPATQPILELLTTIFQAQKAAYLDQCPTDTIRPRLMDRFCTMASELDAGKWLTSLPNCLAHLDLAPRNILVNPALDTHLPIISGVLDWDSAVLAPIFMSCTPPLWIWAWQDDDDEDERTANDGPATPEARQLKQLFEEAAGQEYVGFAYKPVYRLARRLVRFAIDGIQSNESLREAKVMLQEWETIPEPGKHESRRHSLPLGGSVLKEQATKGMGAISRW